MRTSKTSLVALVVLGTVLLGYALRETIASLFVEQLLDGAAKFIGIERPQMMALIAPWLTSFFIVGFVAIGAYKIGQWDRRAKPKLKILYDPASPLSVEIKKGLYGPTGEFYSLGIENIGPETVENVKVRALDSWFTREAIAVSQHGTARTLAKPVDIIVAAELHPGAPEYKQLFGLDYATSVSHPDYIFNTKQRFVIEAFGKDARAVRQEFEYDPNSRPMIKPVL